MSQLSCGASAASKSHLALPYGTWRCQMGPGVARWSLALPDVRGVAGCPPVSPYGVAVCTVALPGGRGVAGWRGALPDNSPTRIPKLNLESEIRVLGPQRNMPVHASRRFETFRFLKRKVARPFRSKMQIRSRCHNHKFRNVASCVFANLSRPRSAVMQRACTLSVAYGVAVLHGRI